MKSVYEPLQFGNEVQRAACTEEVVVFATSHSFTAAAFPVESSCG